MLNKFVAAAVLATLAVPAVASEVSPGRAMLGNLLGLDASAYSLSELAQIDSEKTAGEKAARAQFIAAQHNRGVAEAVALDTSAENPLYPGHSANFGIPSEN
ncbi:MAG: hypothetical protein Q4615_04110 [Paracoccus aminovorans]|nr:hypothetical protein [Paracoccus aminovorans]